MHFVFNHFSGGGVVGTKSNGSFHIGPPSSGVGGGSGGSAGSAGESDASSDENGDAGALNEAEEEAEDEEQEDSKDYCKGYTLRFYHHNPIVCTGKFSAELLFMAVVVFVPGFVFLGTYTQPGVLP